MEQKIRRDRNMGENLRRLRLQSKLSQEKLCAKLQLFGCDIGRTTYAKYESGELNIRASRQFCGIVAVNLSTVTCQLSPVFTSSYSLPEVPA